MLMGTSMHITGRAWGCFAMATVAKCWVMVGTVFVYKLS